MRDSQALNLGLLDSSLIHPYSLVPKHCSLACMRVSTPYMCFAYDFIHRCLMVSIRRTVRLGGGWGMLTPGVRRDRRV